MNKFNRIALILSCVLITPLLVWDLVEYAREASPIVLVVVPAIAGVGILIGTITLPLRSES